MKLPHLPTLLAVAGLLALLAAPVTAITGGEPDGDGHPYVAAIRGFYPDGSPGPVCTGSLVAPDAVLTAAHCLDFLENVFGFTPADVRVTFAPDFEAPDTVWLDVAAFHVHPEFVATPRNQPGDVGLVALAAPTFETEPLALAEVGFLDDLKDSGQLFTDPGGDRPKFVRVGYGVVVEFPPPAFFPIDGVRRVTESEYQGFNATHLWVNSNQSADNGGFCAGDSGGAALWVDPANGLETAVGVTSWGDGCIAHDHIFRIDSPAAAEWIAETIACIADDAC